MKNINKQLLTLASFNLKGGVGKTTFITNLAIFLSQHQKKCLIIDLDSQNNLKVSFDHKWKENLSNYLSNKSPNYDLKKIIAYYNEYLDLICGGEQLFNFENPKNINSMEFLNQKIQKFGLFIKNKYDYILIDFPPRFSYLTHLFLEFTNEIYLINEMEYYSYQALINSLDLLLRKDYQNISKINVIVNGFIHNSKYQQLFFQKFSDTIKNLNNPKVIFNLDVIRRSIQTANAIAQENKPLLAIKFKCKIKNDLIALFKNLQLI